jgi:hypothetical protein
LPWASASARIMHAQNCRIPAAPCGVKYRFVPRVLFVASPSTGDHVHYPPYHHVYHVTVVSGYLVRLATGTVLRGSPT